MENNYYAKNLEFKVYEAVPKDGLRFYVPLKSQRGIGGSSKKEKHPFTFDYYLEQAAKLAKKIDWKKVLKYKRCSIPLNRGRAHTVMFNYPPLP